MQICIRLSLQQQRIVHDKVQQTFSQFSRRDAIHAKYDCHRMLSNSRDTDAPKFLRSDNLPSLHNRWSSAFVCFCSQ